MSRSKLSLPFSQAVKLNDDQKCKLIECQARRIAVQEWEIKAILEICSGNGWIDKGLAVLYEYAGHLDDLKKSVEQRSNCVEDVIDYVMSLTEQHGLLNLAELIKTAEKAAHFTFRSIHVLCSWRRLQCCPKPVFVEEKMGGKWSFQFLLKDEGKRFSDALFQSLSFVNIFDLVPLENIVAILAPFMEFDNFVELMKYQQKYCSGRYKSKKGDPKVDNIDIDSLVRAGSPIHGLYLAIREVIALEDRIEASWETLRSLPLLQQMLMGDERQPGSGRGRGGHHSSPDPSKLYPTLRLPYRSFKAPTGDLAWFLEAVPRYLQLDALLTPFAIALVSNVPSNNNNATVTTAVAPSQSTVTVTSPPGRPRSSNTPLHDQSSQPHESNVVSWFPGAGEAVVGASVTIEKVRGSSGNPSIDPFAASPGGYVGPAGAGFVRARSSQPLAVTPGSRKQVLQLQSPQTLNTSSQQQAELASSIDCWAPFDAASPTHHHGAGVPIPTQQQRHARSSLADCMVLPSRGNNAEQEDAMHGSYTPGTGTDTAAALAAASRSPTGGSFADPNQRKRSVTVAVVGHPDPALSPSRDGADLKRRVTHAGNISAGSTPHQQHFPQLQSTSEGGSLVLGSDKQEATFAHKPLGGYDYSNATAVVVAHSLLPIQEASSPKAVPKINTSNLSLRNPLGAAMVQEGQEETFQKQPPAIADASAAAAMASGSESASASDSFTPQSIIKQRSSFSSDVGGSAKKPSQIIRVASEGHTKTLSFDSTFEDDNSSGVGVGAGSASPNSPANSSRPRNGSYEIIYQETPEERMRMQQMQPEVIFQATPSPHLSRKRAQSTPLHLLLSSPQPRQQQPQIDSPTVYSPAAPIHVSQSLSTLSHYPTFSQPASSAAASSPQAILRSAPAYPVRKVYQGKEGAGGSSQVSTPSPNPRKNYSASKSRLFSARRRERAASAAEGEGGEGAGGEGCDVMETFGMLDTLSKPFTRGESMAESQMIHIALRSMRVEGSTVAGMAARKISVWWRLIAPRKKLLRRMAVREVCRDIVHAMVDSAFLIGTTKQRRHRSLLRNGAAMKIQRCFRFWSNTIMAEERRLEQEERSRIAWRGLSLWANCVMAAIRIYRYVRYCQRRRRGRTPIKLNSSQLLRRTIEKYFVVRTMRKKLELQKDLYTKMKIASMLSHNHSSGRNNLYREREMAVVCIQKAFRAYNLHKQLMERQYFNIMCSKITYFFIRWIARRRVKLNKIKKQAATVIQTFFRGIHIRRRILKIVESGLRLNALWRKHKAYVSLKSQLRRVDRPHTLIMHGIRNISKKTINADHMRFKVSVWWHPLLHIVSQNDFNTIIQSKQPQFIYNSQAFYLVDTAEQKIHRRMSISQGLRKLSSILTTTNRKQSTAHDELPLVNTASKGVFRYSQVLANKSSSLSATARASMASFVGAVSGSGSRQSTYIKALPPIGPPSQQSSSTSSFSKGQSLPGSLLRPSEVSSSSVAPSASSEVVAAGSLPASASSSLAAAASKARKESVEVLRPSALLAAQLDIIHSDDEDEDDSEEEEVEEGGGRGGGSKLGSTSSSKSPSEPRRLPSRSFLANRMGLPVQRSISNRDSREGMNGGDSESGVDSKNTSLADVGAGEVFGSEGEECEGQASDGSSRRNAANSWRRISNVVKNSPDMLLGPGGGGNISSNSAENSPVRDSSESGGDASPFPPSLGSSGKALSSSSSPSKGSTLLRSTLKFMSRGASAQMKSQAQLAADEPKMICHFEDDVIKIPGCHGNSVIKFEIFEGDRKYGTCLFYLSKEGEMMFWGGEYQRNVNMQQQRRAVQFNSHIINSRGKGSSGGEGTPEGASAESKKTAVEVKKVSNSTAMLKSDEPILDFRIIAGAPLRSKCSWGRVAVRGSGPLKRVLKGRDFLSSFLFDKWHRLYFSLDQDGLYLFENKFSTTPLHLVPIKDLKEVSVDVGAPIKQSSADAAKNVAEDIHNVKVVTFTGDELYMRFPDTMTRTAWQESLANAILQHKCAGGSLAVARRAWLSQAISGDSALKGRGLLATAVSEQALEDSPSSASSPSKSAIGGSLPSFGFAVGNDNNNNNSSSPSGGGRGATSHVQRLLQLRSDRAMGPITGGSVPPSPSSSPLQTHPQQQQQQRKNGPDLLALQNLHRGGGRKMS